MNGDLVRDRERGRGVGREREREREGSGGREREREGGEWGEREREIVAGRYCDGVTHTSKHFLVQINLWLSFNHRYV